MDGAEQARMRICDSSGELRLGWRCRMFGSKIAVEKTCLRVNADSHTRTQVKPKNLTLPVQKTAMPHPIHVSVALRIACIRQTHFASSHRQHDRASPAAWWAVFLRFPGLRNILLFVNARRAVRFRQTKNNRGKNRGAAYESPKHFQDANTTIHAAR